MPTDKTGNFQFGKLPLKHPLSQLFQVFEILTSTRVIKGVEARTRYANVQFDKSPTTMAFYAKSGLPKKLLIN